MMKPSPRPSCGVSTQKMSGSGTPAARAARISAASVAQARIGAELRRGIARRTPHRKLPLALVGADDDAVGFLARAARKAFVRHKAAASVDARDED